MNKSTANSELGDVSSPKSAVRISKISLWMGILSTFPYFCAIFSMAYSDFFPITPTTSDWVRLPLRIMFYPMLLGIISGIPFGLAAIITGVIGYMKQLKIQKNVGAAILGILFGIGGILGHIWYIWIFVTCQFCQ